MASSVPMPHVPAHDKVKEFSLRAILLGVGLGFIFAIGNAYLGLKVGMTVSASIPAAVMSMAILRILAKQATILENNIVQTIASAGESMAAGVIFTVPALVLLGDPPSLFRIFVIALLGGLLGVLMMIPLRFSLMVDEHHNLPFPEGTACAEILKAREGEGSRAMLTVWGLFIGAVDKVAMGVFRLWNEVAEWSVGTTRIMLETTPALLGVGFIIGARYALIVFAGGAFAWWALIPLIQYFLTEPEAPLIIWASHIRYIGTGAVAGAGVVSLLRLIPLLHRSLKGQFATILRDVFHRPGKERTERDIPLLWMIGATLVILLACWFLPEIGFNWLSVLLTLLLGFFFVALTAVTVGIIGNSSNPVSGMILITLLITALLFFWLGWTERIYLIMAMTVGCVVGTAVAMSGDTSQDLKTGMLVGATPWMQQVGALIGVILPAATIGYILNLLHATYGFGSDELPAPQATLMAIVARGVIEGNLPFQLVVVGIVISLAVELLGIRSLPFALGLYLPLPTTFAIGLGGTLSHFLKGSSRSGVLLGSGLIAGDALIGIAIAGLAVTGIISPQGQALLGTWATLVAYALLLALFATLVRRKK